MNLIEKLHYLMKKNNIRNIAQLSRETNIPYTTLKSIFDGDVNDIRLSTSRKLCDFFKITLDELLDDNISINSTKNTDFRIASYNGVDVNGLDETDLKEIQEFVNFKRNMKNNKEQ